jgi:hypothetical protein
MNRLFPIIATLAIVFVYTTGGVASEKVVEVEGSSFASKEDAVHQAQRLAVEQAVGVFIHSKTEVENFAIKKDRIMSRTQGYITRFTILREEKAEGLYTVRLSATVSMDKIKDDLLAMKILLDSMERPRLMILIEEEYIGMDNVGMCLAETEISSLLAAKGFDLVDRAQIEKIKSLDQSRQALAGNIAAAKRLGLDFGSQYVIVGKAVVQNVEIQGVIDDEESRYVIVGKAGLKSLQASLQLKVIQTQTGLLLGSMVKNGISVHISPLTGAGKSLRIAAQKAVDEYLVDTITNSFQEFLNNGAPIKLHITGVKSFQQYKLIVSNIEIMDKVVSSKKEAWNKTGGLLVLDLRFKGTSEELAELLDGFNLGKNSLEVVDFAPDRVDFNLR